jgi:hypothetical protein
LIVRCHNAIYGTMVASIQYYRKFTKSLLDERFSLNPYDACVANKTIDGNQMTICFHVDDCKISHRSAKEVDNIIQWLRTEYESIFEDGSGKMKVSRGKIHEYLGMTLDFSSPGIVRVTMKKYIDEVIEHFLRFDTFKLKSTAAPEDLFKIDEDDPLLDHHHKEGFHTIVAKILYATKRARPDTCTAVAFLTTRVDKATEMDWKKLRHLVGYLKQTRDLPLVLSTDNISVVKWWVDGSYATHPDMRGHTGAGLSLGRGFPVVSSTKHKLNTRSSTEAELVSVDDCMPMILWTRYFLLEQGYDVDENILFQDNKSAMLLEQNGRASSSKRTKHINVRYYFVTDRIAKGELKVQWCPTVDMIADYMTKPLQGKLFRKFRDLIMGLASPSQRIVGSNDKTCLVLFPVEMFATKS